MSMTEESSRWRIPSMDVVEAIVAALQCAEEEGLEVPDPVRYPEDGKLGLVFKGREYVATIEEVP